jgi:predicted RNA binding protein YcfA (HicA-like mRNA interferase family)
MSDWPSTKARRVLAALLRLGWEVKVQRGSHRQLRHPDGGLYTFAYHDGVEIGPRALSRIGKATGLRPKDL